MNTSTKKLLDKLNDEFDNFTDEFVDKFNKETGCDFWDLDTAIQHLVLQSFILGYNVGSNLKLDITFRGAHGDVPPDVKVSANCLMFEGI